MGTGIGIAVLIGLLVLTCKVLKWLARALKPAAAVFGLVLIFGLVGVPLLRSLADDRQQDQIDKFFERLVDQVRGVFASEAQAHEATPTSTPIFGQPGAEITTSELSDQHCNPRIDLSSWVKE